MLIKFRAQDGVILEGEFLYSHSERPQPLLVVVPGSSTAGVGSASLLGLRSLAMNLAKNLIVTFIYEGRGFGRSEGTREKQTDSLVDLRGALNFLEAELGESFRWTGVLGHSIGGAAALKLATENPKIGAVMCYGTLPSYKLCSADDRVRKVAEHHWVNSQQKSSFDQYLAQYDPINCLEFADQVNVPVLLSGGGADNEYFRWDEQLRLAQSMLKAPSIEIRSFKEWHHSLEMSAPGFNIACASIAAWFRAIWEQHGKL